MIAAVYSKSHCGKYEGDKYDVIAWFTQIPVMRDLRSTRDFYYVYIYRDYELTPYGIPANQLVLNGKTFRVLNATKTTVVLQTSFSSFWTVIEKVASH